MDTAVESYPLNSNKQEVAIETKNPSWYTLDREMLPSKFSYAFQQATQSCYLPYMNLFLLSTGLNAVQAGQISGLRFIGAIVGAPLWGILADLKKAHRLIVVIICICAVVTMSSQPFISIVITGNNKDNCGHNNVRNNSTNQTFVGTTISNMADVDTKTLFHVMMFINIIASSFDGSTAGFIDSGVIQKINSRNTKTMFGIQRLFGAPGFGLGNVIASLCVEYLPKYNLPCYSAALFVYGVLMLCLVVSANCLYSGLYSNSVVKEYEEEELDEVKETHTRSGKVEKPYKSQHKTSRGIQMNLCNTLLQCHVFFFFITVLVTGTVHGFYLSYLFVLLKQINCPNILMGLSILVGAMSAASVLYFLEKIIKVFGGTMNALFIGCFSWSIRLLLTSYIENPYLILPIQVFQSIGYALFIGAGVTHVKLIASQDIYSSMYGIFNGLFYGTGLIISNVAGGVILSVYGIRRLFLFASIIAFSWSAVMAVYIITQRFCKRRQDKSDNVLL